MSDLKRFFADYEHEEGGNALLDAISHGKMTEMQYSILMADRGINTAIWREALTGYVFSAVNSYAESCIDKWDSATGPTEADEVAEHNRDHKRG